MWPSFFATFLEGEQSEFLRVLVEIAEDQCQNIADVQWTTATEVFGVRAWSTTERADIGRAHAIVNILDAGLIPNAPGEADQSGSHGQSTTIEPDGAEDPAEAPAELDHRLSTCGHLRRNTRRISRRRHST